MKEKEKTGHYHEIGAEAHCCLKELKHLSKKRLYSLLYLSLLYCL